jgi:DNA-binding MarR family transcriptional regulator
MGGQEARERCVDEDLASPVIGGEQAPLKLEQFLPYQLQVVSTLMAQALSRVYARRYHLGIPEWRVLVALGQFGWMNGKAICSHTHMHKTKVSRAVAMLEQRRLITRRANRADMRESLVALTVAGRTIYEELAPHAVTFSRRLTEILTPSDRDAFARALKALTDRSAQLVAEAIEEDGRVEEP